jgi:hypothetical protein
MNKELSETYERLIRVMAVRRGRSVELSVHYEKSMEKSTGCETYRLFLIEDAE